MHDSLLNIQKELGKIIDQIESDLPNDESFGIAHNSWTIPGLSKYELIEKVQYIIDFIEDNETDDLGESEIRITDYVRRLEHLRGHTVPNIWGNSGQAVPVFIHTINGLRTALSPELDKNGLIAAQNNLHDLQIKIRSLEAVLKNLEPHTTSLDEMVKRIELSYNAADKLPADLQALEEAQIKINELVCNSTHDRQLIMGIKEDAEKLDSRLRKILGNAEAVLNRCETAYSAATCVGLAAAFSQRSRALSKSIIFWVCGLVVALAAGAILGSIQLRDLSQIVNVPDTSGMVIILNIILSILSVGAPTWFAWLATKQIGQRFKLSEDYAFKASVSQAYEGFRRETARFDKEMEAKLLLSALTRLDELPLRLVEEISHGSPWHELSKSDVVKKAMKEIPGFSEQVKKLASKAIAATKTSGYRPVQSLPSEQEKNR